MHLRSFGFTLLEAIVALAILAAGAVALFSALNGVIRSVQRIEEAAKLDVATRNALAFLENLNPAERPQGEETLGDYRISWGSQVLFPARDVLTDYLQPGYYEVALFLVDVQLEHEGRIERRFVIRKAGWRQVRFPSAI